MSKPTGLAVAQAAVALWKHGYTYAEMDCQAFVRRCITDAGGTIAYKGVNTMVRSCNAWLGTIENAQASGKLVPGALLLIHKDDDGEPSQYRGDGLGNFDHIGVYIGTSLAISDVDKAGKRRICPVIHSGQTMGHVAGSTLANGWTHVIWFNEIDYGTSVTGGVEIGAVLDEADTVKDDTPTEAVVNCGAGKRVRLRKQPSTKCATYWEVYDATVVSIERYGAEWCLIVADCTDGHKRRAYMMTKFLSFG